MFGRYISLIWVLQQSKGYAIISLMSSSSTQFYLILHFTLYISGGNIVLFTAFHLIIKATLQIYILHAKQHLSYEDLLQINMLIIHKLDLFNDRLFFTIILLLLFSLYYYHFCLNKAPKYFFIKCLVALDTTLPIVVTFHQRCWLCAS